MAEIKMDHCSCKDTALLVFHRSKTLRSANRIYRGSFFPLQIYTYAQILLKKAFAEKGQVLAGVLVKSV